MSSTLPEFEGPAVAFLDIGDIPIALLALDALIKEAPVQLLSSGSVQPGRWLTLFGGEVESCEMAFNKALSAASGHVVDKVFLPWADPRLVPALLSVRVHQPNPGDTLIVLQTQSTPCLIGALDKALKGAEVSLMQIRAAQGLGGQAFATLWGTAHDAEAAQELAQSYCAGRQRTLSSQLIRNADPVVALALAGGSSFFGAVS